MKAKMYFTKQLLSILLCVSMLLTYVPSTVFAAESGQKVVGTSTINNSAYLKGNTTFNEALFNATRTDFRDESVYNLIITRFYDGDSSNNIHCWDDGQAGNPDTDPGWRGDFKGLIEKLDYIKALGFTALRLTPVAQNASGYDYHGYHPINLKEIDFRFESDGYTYEDLIDACHAKGLKVMQEVVINDTSNFGEENLRNLFDVNKDADWSKITEALVPTDLLLEKYPNYMELPVAQQFQARLDLLRESLNSDEIYHRETRMNFDNYLVQQGTIAGDCIDLNTENPVVALYLAESCFNYAAMGVDAIMFMSAAYINRWTLNEGILPLLRDMLDAADLELEIYLEMVDRSLDIWNQNNPSASAQFYTWKETESEWQNNWDSTSPTANIQTSIDHYNAHSTLGDEPTSNNAVLDGITYHTPDYSKSSGMHIYDYNMMWNFKNANSAFNVAKCGDQYVNDATWNLTSVDNVDYGPDGMEKTRYSLGSLDWAENLNLMFTLRGIPSILYGTEIEFQKNMPIDIGPNAPLSETGRAYYGDNMIGTVTSDKFLNFTAYGKVGATLSSPLATHIRQLNAIRMSVPALRKGQYTTSSDYISGNMAFIKRYTNAAEGIDSLALVTISDGATFRNIPNGKYIDAVTGDVQNVTNGTLTVSSIGKGNMRVYVCCSKGFTGLDVSEMPAASRTLRFSANGGSGTINSISVKGNEKATLPECTFAAPENSTFLGWNVNGTMYQPGDEVEFSVNSMARAVWGHTHAFTYTVSDDTITATCTPEDCDNTDGGSVKLIVQDAYFTGNAIGATVEGSFKNGAIYTLTYNDGSETAPSSVGTHKATLTVSENGTQKQSLTLEYKISYLFAPESVYSISGYNYYDETNETYWFKTGAAVTVTATTGYEISKTSDGTYGSTVTFFEGDNMKIYIKRSSDGASTDEIEVEGIRFDENAPVAEIDIKGNKWTSFWNNLTFSLFFNEAQDVTIKATDGGSGIKSIEYYLASGELEIDEVKAIVEWQDYNASFKIEPNEEYVVYAKIVDNVGNTTYVNSDSITLDNIAATLEGIEDGKIYYGDLTVIKSEDQFYDIKRVTLDGEEMGFAEGTYGLISADNEEHTVIVEDHAGNKTTYIVKVMKNYTVTFKVDGETVSTETVGYGKNATLAAVPEKDGYIGKWDSDGKNITGDTTISAVYTVIPVVRPDDTEKPTDTDRPADADKPADSPQTGDNRSLWMWFALMVVSGGALFTVTEMNKKRK